jgi:hypothetical protein
MRSIVTTTRTESFASEDCRTFLYELDIVNHEYGEDVDILKACTALL